MQFSKMHGLGNDFMVVDAVTQNVFFSPELIRRLADRHLGVGFDQLLVVEPPYDPDLDFHYRIFNADGSEVEACGNATRCVATLLGQPAVIETLGGMLRVTPADGGAEVVLGEPVFDWEHIPLAMPMDTRDMPVAWDELEHGAAVNVGNPHIIFFVPEADAVALDELGPRIETDPLFPERVNVNVASLDGENQLQLRVWERGVGLTQACGTGACATAVAAIRAGLVKSPVTVSLPGGDLIIRWAPGEPIVMSGAATRVYDGETDWTRFG